MNPDPSLAAPGPGRFEPTHWSLVREAAQSQVPGPFQQSGMRGSLSTSGRAVQALGDQFQRDLGIKVTVETPEKLTDSFPIAAQAGKGPDIVIWAHDKVAEWADGGLIAPVWPSPDFTHQCFPAAWQAVAHAQHLWGSTPWRGKPSR